MFWGITARVLTGYRRWLLNNLFKINSKNSVDGVRYHFTHPRVKTLGNAIKLSLWMVVGAGRARDIWNAQMRSFSGFIAGTARSYRT